MVNETAMYFQPHQSFVVIHKSRYTRPGEKKWDIAVCLMRLKCIFNLIKALSLINVDLLDLKKEMRHCSVFDEIEMTCCSGCSVINETTITYCNVVNETAMFFYYVDLEKRNDILLCGWWNYNEILQCGQQN